MQCYSGNSKEEFQSPQWGSNSKAYDHLKLYVFSHKSFQSPQWGSNSKDDGFIVTNERTEFQSPQWGSNSKVKNPRL